MLTRLAAVVRDRGDLALRIVLASVQIAFIAWFSPGRGLPLDDAWIHQVVARTFAETGTLGYAPGHHGAAATSYLWAALLAVDFKLLHLDAGRWALILNAISALASGQLLYSLLLRARSVFSPDLGEREWKATSLAVTAFALCSPNILWFVCSGMEAMPFIALSLTAIWASTDPASAGLRRAVLGGVAAGALAFLRPEAAPLGGLLAVHAFGRQRDSRRATAIGIPWLLAVAVYIVSNIAKTGHALPSTLAGRRWLWFEMSTGLSRMDRVFDFLDQWGTRLGTYTFDTSLAVVWIFVAIAGYGAFRLCRRAPDGATGATDKEKRVDDGPKVLFAWALFHATFYALLLPTSGHGGRYQPLTPLLFTACLPIGIAVLLRELLRLIAGAEAKSFLWFAALGIAPCIALSSPVGASLRDANALAVAHIQATELDAGTYVSTLPEGAIASFDIGGIGYAAKKRRILDLGGLSDPSTASLLETGRIWTWLESNKVRFIVLPASYEHVLPIFEDYGVRLHLRDNPAVHLDAVRVFETPFDKWEPAIKATWNAAPKQIVYEVTYTSREGPSEGAALLPPDAMREIADPANLIPRRERVVAEHMLATLAAWGMPVDVRVTSSATEHASGSASASSAGSATITGAAATATAPTFDLASGGVIGGDPNNKPSSSLPCGVRVGSWGIAFEGGCANDVVLRAIAYEHIGRYLDVGDLGGAVRAIPHVLVQAKRRTDPRFHPPIAPLTPPIPGGVELLAMRSNGWGLVLGLAIFLAAIGIEIAARRNLRLPRLVTFVRTKLPALAVSIVVVVVVAACGPSDSDVTRATARGRGAVEIAIANGGNVNEIPGTHRVPLLAAATVGDPEVVALLLERGARLEVITFDGGSPLHVAARRNHHAVVTVLASAMATAARKTATPGHELEAVKAALSITAGPRSRTALHDAAANGSIETVTALLAAGADATKTDSFGQTPLHLVANAGNAANSADGTKSAFIGALLLAAGSDPRLLDARGFTPLHAAVVANNAHLVRAMLQNRGGLVEDRTTAGESPLDLALRYEHDAVAETLLRFNANFTRSDAWPPLHDAARLDAMVRIANLIATGADTERRFRNKTALDIALESGSKRAAALLIRGGNSERPR